MHLSPKARHRLAAGAVISAVAVAVPGVAMAATPGFTAPTTAGPSGTVSTDPGSPAPGQGPAAHTATGIGNELRSCTAATFSTAQQAVEQAISDRLTTIGKLQSTTAKATGLSAADGAALNAMLAAELHSFDGAGLIGLQSTVQAETGCSQVRASAKTMVTGFRVYVLAVPQVRATVAVDAGTARAAKITADLPKIQARIAKAAQSNKDVAAAQQAFNDLQTQVTTATNALSTVSVSQLLAQAPADYPADESQLQADVSAVKTAVSAWKAARSDLSTIRSALR